MLNATVRELHDLHRKMSAEITQMSFELERKQNILAECGGVEQNLYAAYDRVNELEAFQYWLTQNFLFFTY